MNIFKTIINRLTCKHEYEIKVTSKTSFGETIVGEKCNLCNKIKLSIIEKQCL